MTPYSSILQRRGIQRVVHFHCDHFEPGRKDNTEQVIGLAHTRTWCEACESLPWARKASLFYFSRYLSRIMDTSEPELSRRREKGQFLLDIGGGIWLGASSMADEDTEIVKYLVSRSWDFHVHIHHEFWCSGPKTGLPVDEVADSERLTRKLDFLLDRYSELGALPRGAEWGFVHGCWALNASDREICNVIDECMILQSRGCFGDFSSPGGRPHCNPARIKVPYTFTPFRAERCYDLSETDSIPVGEGSFKPGRFMVWNSRNDTNRLSLDNIVNAAGVITPENAVTTWLEDSPVIKGVLFLKTHAHSLWQTRWTGPVAETCTSPMLHPLVAGAFNLLGQVAPVEYMTVRGALAALREVDR